MAYTRPNNIYDPVKFYNADTDDYLEVLMPEFAIGDSIVDDATRLCMRFSVPVEQIGEWVSESMNFWYGETFNNDAELAEEAEHAYKASARNYDIICNYLIR